jgi:bacteriorhodopsin
MHYINLCLHYILYHMNLNIYTSLIVSIVTQVITGIIELLAVFIKTPTKMLLLKQLLVLELFVQIIEGSFYVYWFYNFTNIVNITPKRYFDWAITTPTMLITLIFYLIYLKYKEDDIEHKLEFFELFNQEFYTIIIILLLNWLMLLFGYLGEINMLPVLLGVSLGFIPFLIYYYIIYKKYAVLSNQGLTMFFYFFIIWSLYGVVAILPYQIKNMGYNILDLFAKNFFGIFLSYLLFTNM